MKINIRILVFLFLYASSSNAMLLDIEIPYFKSKGIIEQKEVKSNKLFKLIDLKIAIIEPSTKDSTTVKAHYFKNAKGGKKPLLIIAPPIGGISIREKSVSKYFLRKGFNVIVVEPIKNISDNSIAIIEFENNLLSFIGAIRSVVDVMEELPEIQKDNIFIWASSMGAIYSSIVIEIDSRINASILILGAGSIPDIMTESNQKHIVNYRTERMFKENLNSIEEFRAKMRSNIEVDPIMHANKNQSSKVFFVMSTKDKTVPTKYQQQLYESLGSPPNIKRYKSNHAITLMRSHLFGLNTFYKYIESNIKR